MNLPHPAETARATETQPEKGFMDFNEGDPYTGIGRRIEELVMKTDAFIVFIDEFGGVQWGYDEVPVSAEDYSVVSNRVAELETRSRFLWNDRPCPPNTKTSEHQAQLFGARRLIAEGISRLLDSGSLATAQGIPASAAFSMPAATATYPLTGK